MTNFERIKAMDVIDLAIMINSWQTQAVFDFEKGFYPSSVFECVKWLGSEVQYEAD